MKETKPGDFLQQQQPIVVTYLIYNNDPFHKGTCSTQFPFVVVVLVFWRQDFSVVLEPILELEFCLPLPHKY